LKLLLFTEFNSRSNFFWDERPINYHIFSCFFAAIFFKNKRSLSGSMELVVEKSVETLLKGLSRGIVIRLCNHGRRQQEAVQIEA